MEFPFSISGVPFHHVLEEGPLFFQRRLLRMQEEEEAVEEEEEEEEEFLIILYLVFLEIAFKHAASYWFCNAALQVFMTQARCKGALFLVERSFIIIVVQNKSIN